MNSSDNTAISRILCDLPSSNRKCLLPLIEDYKIKILLRSSKDFGYRIRIPFESFSSSFESSKHLSGNTFKMSLSQSNIPDVNELRNLDFERPYSRAEILSKLPYIWRIFKADMVNGGDFLIKKERAFDFLINYAKFCNKKYVVAIPKKEALLVRHALAKSAVGETRGRRKKIFGDRFYELFLISMQPSRTKFSIDSIVSNIYSWSRDFDYKNDEIRNLTETEIRSRVKSIYEECKIKNI